MVGVGEDNFGWWVMILLYDSYVGGVVVGRKKRRKKGEDDGGRDVSIGVDLGRRGPVLILVFCLFLLKRLLGPIR